MFQGRLYYVKKNSEVSSVADLKNHNTVVVMGTTAEKTLKKYFIKSNVIRAVTYTEAFNAVNNDTCMISDEAILRGFVMDNPNYIIYNKKLTEEPYAVAIRKDEEQLLQNIDFTIKALEKSGKLEKIKNKWIK